MPLRLLKSALFGVVTSVCGLVLWIVGSVAVGLLWLRLHASGTGGLGAVSGEIPGTGGLLFSLVGFIVGSAWMYRRLQRRAVR